MCIEECKDRLNTEQKHIIFSICAFLFICAAYLNQNHLDMTSKNLLLISPKIESIHVRDLKISTALGFSLASRWSFVLNLLLIVDTSNQ